MVDTPPGGHMKKHTCQKIIQEIKACEMSYPSWDQMHFTHTMDTKVFQFAVDPFTLSLALHDACIYEAHQIVIRNSGHVTHH